MTSVIEYDTCQDRKAANQIKSTSTTFLPKVCLDTKIGETKMANRLQTLQTGEKRDLTTILKKLDAQCQNCAPTSALECINRCKVYKLKNELRNLREAMNNPNYTKELFNVLKNQTRLHILKSIADGRYSVSQLQQELKKNGYNHSQDTIHEEYLQPLMSVGLAMESCEHYYATQFGGRLTETLEIFPEFAEVLPAHSECYEETLLQTLISGPKTFEDIEKVVSPKIASRILKRLRQVGLLETPEERDYIFFFKSKRDPNKETLTSTEEKVYRSIPDEGISAGKLAKEADLSIRRIYKYLRGLKGKKLVFVRKTPKAYALTDKGTALASVLEELNQIVEETWSSSRQVFHAENA